MKRESGDVYLIRSSVIRTAHLCISSKNLVQILKYVTYKRLTFYDTLKKKSEVLIL